MAKSRGAHQRHCGRLHPAVIVALVTLSIAPVGALFPQGMTALVGQERRAYAHAVFFVSTLLSVVVTTIAVEALNLYSGGAVHVDPFDVAGVAVGSLLLPLGVGLAIGKWSPRATPWIPVMRSVSGTAVVITEIAVVPYKIWRTRTGAGPPAVAPPPSGAR